MKVVGLGLKTVSEIFFGSCGSVVIEATMRKGLRNSAKLGGGC